MKNKIIFVFITVCTILFAFGIITSSAARNGTCGDNLTWILDDNGTLTISGNGEMHDVYNYSPWYSVKDRIISVVIEDGVTSISNLSFYYCSELESVIIPSTVTTIGYDAFYWCDRIKRVDISDIDAWCKIEFITPSSNPLTSAGNLYLNGNLVTNLTISESITSVNDYVFTNCSHLTSITIPDSVTNVGMYAFGGCVNLTSVIIGNGVTNISDYAFSNCRSLKNISMSKNVRKIGTCAFENCSNLANIYYDGVKGQWEATSINAYNAPLKSATIHFIKKTQTTLSDDGTSFVVTPINVETGKTVILALYDGDKLVEMQNAVYTGESIPFGTTKSYTDAKVMVWDNLTNLKPVCVVENIE